MGEILPDGTIQGYSKFCPICQETVDCNIQGEITGHTCTKINKEAIYKWVDDYYENVGDECGGCNYSYYESDTNFGMCRAADGGNPENCPEWQITEEDKTELDK